METLESNKIKMFKGLFVLVVILSVYFTVKTFGDIRGGRMMWDRNDTPATISFSGHGEVSAVPDIANVYFNISKDAKTIKEAQEAVAVVEKKALDFLKTKSVDEKDVKTNNASFYPKYDYQQRICPPVSVGGTTTLPSYYCGGGKQVLVGYTSSESITVKIRNTDDVGAIMQGLGTTGVSDLSGPNFSIDKEDSLKAEARKKAIDDAKGKAEVLARDLGVRLVKIVSFDESGRGYPMMYAKDSMMNSGAVSAAPAQLPKGENTISSDVTITYEIR